MRKYVIHFADGSSLRHEGTCNLRSGVFGLYDGEGNLRVLIPASKVKYIEVK